MALNKEQVLTLTCLKSGEFAKRGFNIVSIPLIDVG